MTTQEILNLDYRKKENQDIIQKVLKRIKPLSKYSDEEVPLQAIEKLIKVLTNKYDIHPQSMVISCHESSSIIYSIPVKTSNSFESLGMVHGMCLYEVFAKLAIKMFSDVKHQKVAIRVPTKEEKQRERIAKKVDAEKLNKEEAW